MSGAAQSWKTYQDVWTRSIEAPEEFWREQSRELDWVSEPSTVLQRAGDTSWRWYPDGVLNVSVNALDRHVDAGHGGRIALHHDSGMTGARTSITYRELRDRVARFAGALRDLGVGRGDRVLVYLPMTPEAVVAMLAGARLGAVHSVVFGGFAANELAVRIADAEPTVVLTASGGLEPSRVVEYLPIVRRALELAPGHVRSVVVHDRPEVPGSAADVGSDIGDVTDDEAVAWLDWATLEAAAAPADPVPVRSTDPLYVLYTSGTTGKPKGVVRDSGGYAVALSWAMRNIYDIGPGDTFFTASDVGWVVGHSFIVYGPLIVGATTVLYEGKPVGTPDAGAFWRILAEHGAKALFTAPTALRAIRRVDPDLTELARYELPALEALFVAGERLDSETYHWAEDGLGVPVVDHWWQTETGWPICANPLGLAPLPAKAGSTAVPMPGFDVRILDGTGAEVSVPEQEGNIGVRLPLPPGTLLGIWGSEERFVTGYLSAFPGYYTTGDAGHVDEDGYVYVMGRTDDVINVAGHRLSTGALEEVLALHPAVAECAVIGVHDELKGQRAAGFVTLKAGQGIDHAKLATELIALVRERIGPVAAFRDVTVVGGLPKTRSGKILRKTMRQIVDGEPVSVPPTIEDPATLDALAEAVRSPRPPG